MWFFWTFYIKESWKNDHSFQNNIGKHNVFNTDNNK